MNPLPPFDKALAGFITFAQSQGAPADLLFVEPDDVVLTGRFLSVRSTARDGRRESAMLRYEAACKAGLGAKIAGIAGVGEQLVCVVYRPINEREAEERIVPGDIKYSLRMPLPEARFTGRILWLLISWRARRDSWLKDWKRDTFGHTG